MLNRVDSNYASTSLNIILQPFILAVLITPGLAYAQAGVLEEITVTATRRETSLQDTAISITAFSGSELERQGSVTLVDYGAKVPNIGLNFSSLGRFNSGSAAIRGIGSSAVAEGATGFYIDDVPVPEYMNPHVTDVERIEVLRGPQGTLFGARSMGGTVRVITKQANAEELDGYMHTSAADVKEGGMEWAVDGAVNVPIIKDVLGARALLYYSDKSGIYDVAHFGPASPRPAFEPISNVDDLSTYGGQLSLTWHVTDNITIKPRYMYERKESDGAGYADFTEGNFSRQLRHNFTDESGNAEFWIGNVTINIDTPVGEIVSTTARYERTVREREDMGEAIDFYVFQAPPSARGFGLPTGPQLSSTVLLEVDDDSIIHETRFVSDFGNLGLDNLSFTMGIFYEDREKLYNWPDVDSYNSAPGINAVVTNIYNGGVAAGFIPPPAVPFPPGLFGTDIVFAGRNGPRTFKELALFGELTIGLTENLRLTAGLRWADTEVTFTETQQGFVVASPVQVSITPDGQPQKDTVLNPKVLMELDISDDMMVYAAASKGFRFGGVNGEVPILFCGAELAALGLAPADLGTYDSDSIWNYELGAKTSWFGNRLTVNMALFHINWNDVIQESVLGSCGFTFASNAGSAENEGLEVEIRAVPVDGLNISMGMGLTDAKLTASTPSAGTMAGDRITQVPEVTFNASAEYTFPFNLFDNWEAYIRGDFITRSNVLSANNAEPGRPTRIRDGYHLLDLRIGAYQADNWDVSLFIKNVTNKDVNYSDSRPIAIEKPGRPRIMTNRPRSIGVELRKYF